MVQRFTTYILTKREKGQSLVEVALFFPIFLIILAGVVEVSHLGITQNRISNAARASARFASQGGEDAGMVLVALNSVTQTLDLEPEFWDMWSIRGELNDDGTDFTDWEFTKTYGMSHTEAFSDVNEANIKQQVLDELQFDDASGAANIRFAGAYIIHDVESIIGLQAIPSLLGFNSVRGLNVMRVYGIDFDETGGCTGFPIAVKEGIRSVNPPGTGTSNDYPAATDFHSSSPKPSYTQFFRNVPNEPLKDAKEGYIYKVQNGDGTNGDFGWLVWNNGINQSANTLQGSLTWPGDSMDYSPQTAGQAATPLYPHPVLGYVNPYDTSDLGISINNWVTVSNGSINSGPGRDILNEHIAKNRYMRLIVWGEDNSSTPVSPHKVSGKTYYKIKGFAIFRLLGHKLPQNGESWILAEFIRWDTSCGQADTVIP